MPLYEFECGSCSEEFEELVPYGTQAVPCPRCGSRDVHRKVSVCGFSVGGKMTTTASHSGCTGCSSTSCTSCSVSHGHR